MEKRLQVIFFLIFLFFPLFSQTPSVVEHIRIPLWAELDAYPELLQDSEIEAESYPIKKIREVAPFLISGMVYGWDFVYTPSDAARNVEEYFELTEKKVSDKELIGIKYSSPWIQDNRLNCWCEYTRTPMQIQNYNLWASIQNPTIQGQGFGSISLGFDGIVEATKDAVKKAVREHYRGQIKNKPKEITGSVLIRKQPLLGIDAGKYTIKLDFFLECGTIRYYTVF